MRGMHFQRSIAGNSAMGLLMLHVTGVVADRILATVTVIEDVTSNGSWTKRWNVTVTVLYFFSPSLQANVQRNQG